MEYLITYGWAIVIIVVVFVILYSLNVFNPMTFAPKASAGSCRIIRPNGPGTIQFISLQGLCNGEIPTFVANFPGSGQVSSNSLSTTLTAGKNNTVSFWMYWKGGSGQSPVTFNGYGLYFQSATCFGFYSYSNDVYGINPTGLSNTWIFVAAQFYNGVYTGNSILYINGAKQTLSQCAGSAQSPTTSNAIYMSGSSNSPTLSDFNGYLANFQMYNSAISANGVQALYIEGIGGSPLNIQNVIGWWPLNGDTTDYSGNNNNVTTNSGFSFISNWYTGYTIP
jgi:hypothetical protein